MSKKSTTRTGSEGDCELRSVRARIARTETHSRPFSGNTCKTDPKQHLVGDVLHTARHRPQVSNRQVSLQKSNITSANTSVNSCGSSLDGDLYSTKDSYLENLNNIRKELNLVSIGASGHDLNKRHYCTTRTSISTAVRNNNAHYSRSLERQMTNLSLAAPFTTFVRHDNRTNAHERMHDNRADSGIRAPFITIFKADSIYDTESTVSTTSSESYVIPTKRLCTRERTPTFLSFEEFPKITSFKKQDCASPVSSRTSTVSYSVPCKKFCIRDDSSRLSYELVETPTIQNKYASDSSTNYNPVSMVLRSNISENSRFKFCAKTVSTTCFDDTNGIYDNTTQDFYVDRATSVTSKDISNNETPLTCSSVRSTSTELCLNLPCSIQENSSSSSYATPIEPNIIILNRQESFFFKSQRRLSSSSNSASLCSSPIQNEADTSRRNLSILPSCSAQCFTNLSSSLSSENSDTISPTQASADDSYKDNSLLRCNYKNFTKTPSKTFSDKSQSTLSSVDADAKLSNATPAIASSLVLPKKAFPAYEFPAFTRVTEVNVPFPNKNYPPVIPQTVKRSENRNIKYVSASSSDSSSLLTGRYSSYKETANRILQSPRISPSKRVINIHDGLVGDEINPIDLKDEASRNFLAVRKTQSVDIRFYAVPSPNRSESSCDETERQEVCRNEDSDVGSESRGCTCMPIFFPRRRRHFFS